jgi:hypothetical protein
MPASLSDRDFYVLQFENTMDAAAFVAALSRFLNSPVGSTYVDGVGSIQVWSYLSARGHGVQVFLSPDALEAASAAFAPVFVAGRRRRDQFPVDCTLVFDGDNVPAWGLTEVEHILICGRS